MGNEKISHTSLFHFDTWLKSETSSCTSSKRQASPWNLFNLLHLTQTMSEVSGQNLQISSPPSTELYTQHLSLRSDQFNLIQFPQMHPKAFLWSPFSLSLFQRQVFCLWQGQIIVPTSDLLRKMNPFSHPKREFNYPTYRTLITYRPCQDSHGAAQAVFTFVKFKVSRASQSPHISIRSQGHLIERKTLQESSAHHPLVSGHLTPQLRSTKSLPNTSLGSSSEIKLFSFPASYHPSLQWCPLNKFMLSKVMKWQQKVSWDRLADSSATKKWRMIWCFFSSTAVTRWDTLPMLRALRTCRRSLLISTYF